MVICLEQSANDLHMVQFDATATPLPLASVKFRMVYLSDAGFPGRPGKEAIKQML